MSTQPESNGKALRTGDPTLADCDDNEVLRCRDSETGLTWYFEERDGRVYRYHEFHGFEASAILREQVAVNCAHTSVDVAVVGRRQLEILRGEGDG